MLARVNMEARRGSYPGRVMLRTHFGGVLTLRVWVVKFIPQQNSLSA